MHAKCALRAKGDARPRVPQLRRGPVVVPAAERRPFAAARVLRAAPVTGGARRLQCLNTH